MSIVFSLCRDPLQPEAYIWVGTAGGGLACMEMATGQCRWYTVRDGLPNNVIYGILPDGVGHLWISTNKGLCRLDPRTELMRTFTKADGLCGNEFNRYSAVASADGRLFFGGMEGITWFDPADFPVEEPPSTTVLTELRLLNRPVNSIRSPELLPAPIHWVNELTIPHSQQMITFAFTCMDHTAPEYNQYRYQLEGLNKGWVHNGSLREATFTNLDPGHYTFRVQGRNHAGIWDPEGASISLTVTPPWYRTWAFRISILVALLGGAYMLYRSKLRQAMAVMHVRERIARDLHDSIGSTLSSVALYSTVVRSKVGDQMPQASAILDRITESTTEVMEAMNDIVWAVNTKNDDMAHVVQRMRAFAAPVAEAAGMQLVLEVQPGVEDLALDMHLRRDFYLIFKEAVNNAVKCGQARTVRVGLTRTGGRVELVVEDDGVGFDPGLAADRNGTGGSGLPNMQRRAREMGGELTIRSAQGAGTCITLRFGPRHR